jgi:hypothetical protein
VSTGMSFSSTPTEAPSKPLRVPRRRRLWLVVTGVLLATGAAYGNYVLVTAQDERVQILVLARDVLWGQQLDEGDLAVAQAVADPQVHHTDAAARTAVIGKVAAVHLTAGRVLTSEDLTDRAVPGASEQVVGFLCKPGTLPSRGVRPGDPISVVPVSSGQTTSAPQAFRGQVAGIGQVDVNGAVTVDVLVPADRAAEAAFAAAGPVIISLLGPQN